jgi:hypothetical protein
MRSNNRTSLHSRQSPEAFAESIALAVEELRTGALASYTSIFLQYSSAIACSSGWLPKHPCADARTTARG